MQTSELDEAGTIEELKNDVTVAAGEESGPERRCEGGQSLEAILTSFVFILKARGNS